MLYSTIYLIIIVLFAIFSQIMTLYAVKFGLKIAEKPEKTAEEPFFNVPKKKKDPKMTPEEQRTMKILQNIDRYDGSANGQVKVK